MAGKEVREYTNLSDPKDKKWGKGKDKIDDEDITFQRMVAKVFKKKVSHCLGASLGWAKPRRGLVEWVMNIMQEMQEVAGERGGYLHGRGALDSDDLLYLKEQMEAEEDAERLLRRTEKRAFAAFKKAASLADSAPASVPLALRVEPKPKSGIRQQDLLKRVVEVKPKRPRVSSQSDLLNPKHDIDNEKVKENPLSKRNKTEGETEAENPVRSLLGLAYASSDDEDD